MSYKGFDLEKLKRMASSSNERSTAEGGWLQVEFDEPAALRILPQVDGDHIIQHHLHPLRLSKNQYAWTLDDKRRLITCRAVHEEDRCPVCELEKWCIDNGETQFAEAIKIQKKNYCAIIDRQDDQIKFLSITPGGLASLLRVLGKKGDIFDPKKGYDLILTKTGNPKNSFSIRYNFIADAKPSPIGLDEWEEKTPKIKDQIFVMKEAEIMKCIQENLGTLLPLDKVFKK